MNNHTTARPDSVRVLAATTSAPPRMCRSAAANARLTRARSSIVTVAGLAWYLNSAARSGWESRGGYRHPRPDLLVQSAWSGVNCSAIELEARAHVEPQGAPDCRLRSWPGDRNPGC